MINSHFYVSGLIHSSEHHHRDISCTLFPPKWIVQVIWTPAVKFIIICGFSDHLSVCVCVCAGKKRENGREEEKEDGEWEESRGGAEGEISGSLFYMQF